MLFATIMAGGSGTRFWPASRKRFPKQLLSLAGERTMLQATVDRLKGICATDQILILTNEVLVDATRQQLPQLPNACLIGEPCKRDTAPCIGLAAHIIAQRDPHGIMLVMPADHVIQNHQQFQLAVDQAVQLVREDESRLVTFGIRPSYPATVFGYIERDAALPDAAAAFGVKRFCEKPDVATAQQFLDSGSFYWNAGIFVWNARTILNALECHEPQMAAQLQAISASIGRDDFAANLRTQFAAIDGKSIDFAVMEKHDNICVIEAPFDWDDLGNWSAIERLAESDENGNTVIGLHLGIATQNCIVRSADRHLVMTLGLKNCIVVHTPDATLVAHRNDESAMRQVVAKLEEHGFSEYL